MERYLERRDRHESFRIDGQSPRKVEGKGPGAADELWAELESMTVVRSQSRVF